MSKPLPTFLDVVAYLATADITPEQHGRIVEVINARVKTARKTAMSSLSVRVGDMVRWTSKYGTPMQGTVTGTGRTRVYVSSDGQRWSISPSLLTKV
ncbi:MAG: hypothetical protein EBS48_08340 [Actinobacteria bacterium]|nr:hypothetical protein [Candidatus Aquidulcis sp.]NBU17001.1 hypothetical protein [Actinomycetota bacterium]